MKKYLRYLLPLLLMALVLTGCDRTATKASAPDPGPETFSVTVEDDAGQTLTLDEAPERLLSLAPSNTEILFALGLGERIVGVTDFCDFPEEAKEKEKVGGFADPNIEKILSLEPDLIFAVSGLQDTAVERLRDEGFNVFVINPKTVDELPDVIRRVGRVADVANDADELAGELEDRILAVKEKVAEATGTPSVFYEVYSEPLMTAGKNTIINDVIGVAGGASLGNESDENYPQFSLETLIEQDPDVYFASTGSMSEPKDIAAREGWDGLTVSTNGRIHVIDENIINRSGPRLIDALEQFAELIHPDLY